jgi:uncharacterized protein (TIGR02444 family)
MERLDQKGPHWAFSLAVYMKPGVSEACVLLQDRCGLDVNLLLIALYAASRGSGTPDGHWLRTADDAIAELREKVIVPLRHARCMMKAYQPPAPELSIEPLRQRVKGLELEAEQLELAMLARLAPPAGSMPQRFEDVVWKVLEFYAAGNPTLEAATDASIADAVKIIADAAYPAATKV